MDKKSAIDIVNGNLGQRLLHGRNTSFANINASQPVWWLNIKPSKFTSELHLLLADDSKERLTWLRIEPNSIPAPERSFRIRGDNGDVDLAISCLPTTYMTDINKGGTGGAGYNFRKHIEYEGIFEETMAVERTGTSVQQVASDALVFQGTQVLTKELHAYLREDWNVYGFLHKFPSVSMEQALAELERDARATAKRIMERNEEVAEGALVFERTDVPVKRMFDYLADLKSLKDFHWDFPEALLEDTHDGVLTAGRLLELDAYRGVENDVVHSDRGRVSGSPVFVGTRLPMIFLFEHLAEGKTLKDFRFSYSSADPEQLVKTVKAAAGTLEREFHAAVSG